MTFPTFTTRDGDSTDVSGDRLDRFGAALTGTLLRQGDAAYDQARTVWNATIDRRPAAIARCATAADVATAVDFARETGARLAVRGGGHNIAGHAVCDGGLMIDLSTMRGIDVDPATGRVSVGPGAPLADLDAATAAYGLAVPTGSTRRPASPG
jgi:FAD/FMN-containing dehydrogenase